MPDTHGPGSYWRDPARAAQARQAMKDAWAARRHFVVFGKAMPRTRVTTPQEVADLVGRSVTTVKVYLARGKGEARFAQHDGTQLFVRRVYRRTYGQV
jgi:hypothetical protein